MLNPNDSFQFFRLLHLCLKIKWLNVSVFLHPRIGENFPQFETISKTSTLDVGDRFDKNLWRDELPLLRSWPGPIRCFLQSDGTSTLGPWQERTGPTIGWKLSIRLSIQLSDQLIQACGLCWSSFKLKQILPFPNQSTLLPELTKGGCTKTTKDWTQHLFHCVRGTTTLMTKLNTCCKFLSICLQFKKCVCVRERYLKFIVTHCLK